MEINSLADQSGKPRLVWKVMSKIDKAEEVSTLKHVLYQLQEEGEMSLASPHISIHIQVHLNKYQTQTTLYNQWAQHSWPIGL